MTFRPTRLFQNLTGLMVDRPIVPIVMIIIGLWAIWPSSSHPTIKEQAVVDVATLRTPPIDRIMGEALVISGDHLSVDRYKVRLADVHQLTQDAATTLYTLINSQTVWCHIKAIDAAGFGIGHCGSIHVDDFGAKLVHAGVAQTYEDPDYAIIQFGAQDVGEGVW